MPWWFSKSFWCWSRFCYGWWYVRWTWWMWRWNNRKKWPKNETFLWNGIKYCNEKTRRRCCWLQVKKQLILYPLKHFLFYFLQINYLKIWKIGQKKLVLFFTFSTVPFLLYLSIKYCWKKSQFSNKNNKKKKFFKVSTFLFIWI